MKNFLKNHKQTEISSFNYQYKISFNRFVNTFLGLARIIQVLTTLAMSGSDREDSITTLNTALNKSMILMDSPLEPKNKTKSGKLIKINEKIQPASPSYKAPPVVPKSILKKSKSQDISEDLDSTRVLPDQELDPSPENEESAQNHIPRPHNVSNYFTSHILS